jgi:hypothetical protein
VSDEERQKINFQIFWRGDTYWLLGLTIFIFLLEKNPKWRHLHSSSTKNEASHGCGGSLPGVGAPTCPMATRSNRYSYSINSMRQNSIKLSVLRSDCSNIPNSNGNNGSGSSKDSQYSKNDDSKQEDYDDNEKEHQHQQQQDTIRGRIWQILANGQEVSLSQLSLLLGGGIPKSEIRHHLSHVKKQAKTFGNKSTAWRIRRGVGSESAADTTRVRLEERPGYHGKRRETFVRLRRG